MDYITDCLAAGSAQVAMAHCVSACPQVSEFSELFGVIEKAGV